MKSTENDVQIFPDLTAATDAALGHIIRMAITAIEARGRFTIALSGGESPVQLYTRLGQPPCAQGLPWAAIQIFWGDERCVPPNDPESNYGMAKRTLLDHVPVPPENVHRMRGEIDPPAAAAEYEAEMQRVFGLKPGEFPRFDLIQLGMGANAHTASLFPHTAALKVQDKLAVANHVEDANADRLTLTVPVINNARDVLFLLAGEEKAEALQEVLEGPSDPERLPSQLIRPHDGQLTWLVDRAAASKLRQI